jgi:hypothetical protein
MAPAELAKTESRFHTLSPSLNFEFMAAPDCRKIKVPPKLFVRGDNVPGSPAKHSVLPDNRMSEADEEAEMLCEALED